MAEHGNGGGGRGMRWDPTINLGHVLTILTLAIGGTVTFVQLRATQDAQGQSIARLESDRKEDRRSIEATFMEKINDQKAMIQTVNVGTSANISEIKASLVRIEEKLDRKADKPGYPAR